MQPQYSDDMFIRLLGGSFAASWLVCMLNQLLIGHAGEVVFSVVSQVPEREKHMAFFVYVKIIKTVFLGVLGNRYVVRILHTLDNYLVV